MPVTGVRKRAYLCQELLLRPLYEWNLQQSSNLYGVNNQLINVNCISEILLIAAATFDRLIICNNREN